MNDQILLNFSKEAIEIGMLTFQEIRTSGIKKVVQVKQYKKNDLEAAYTKMLEEEDGFKAFNIASEYFDLEDYDTIQNIMNDWVDNFKYKIKMELSKIIFIKLKRLSEDEKE